MSFVNLLLTFLLAAIPITELRFAIPFGISRGIAPLSAFFAALLGNILVIPFIFIFLDKIHPLLLRLKPYKTLFNKYIKRIRKRREHVKRSFDKFGYIALAVFVAIPLPGTGAWTGSLIAWLLVLRRRKSMLAIAIGVLIGAILVMLASIGVANFFG